jgi:50S ribosomal subunit-associated GTPase HflX
LAHLIRFNVDRHAALREAQEVIGIRILEDKSARMQYQEGRSNDEWEQAFDEASARKATGRISNAGGYETEIDLKTKKRRLEARIIELKQEIEAIEKVLESKLR